VTRTAPTLALAVFDLDGTLKPLRDPYVHLHEQLGVVEAAEALTARGLAGELTYEEWLRGDAGLWKGTPRAVVEQIVREIPYAPGARETIAALQEHNVEVALVSAGLLFHAEIVAQELHIPHVFANEILFGPGEDGDGEVVTGDAVAIVTITNKDEVVAALQDRLGIPPARTMVVGDTRGDLPMFERAAVSVAVQPNHPQVSAAADIVLPTADLHPLLTRLNAHAPTFYPPSRL
jgi:HAD superfamily PSPase-like hydrolase